MAKTVVGLFDHFIQAQSVVQDLVEHGFERGSISLIAADQNGDYARDLAESAKQDLALKQKDASMQDDAGAENLESEPGRSFAGMDEAGDHAVKGTEIGAVLGGMAGLVVGLGAFAIPGIGPVIGAGPILATLSGAGIGAVTGGMVGSLTESGIPEEDATIYSEGVRRGGTLVLIHAEDDRAEQAMDILNRYHPVDHMERADDWKREERKHQWPDASEGSEPFMFTQRKPYRDRAPESALDFGLGARAFLAGRAISDYRRSEADPDQYEVRSGEDWRVFEARFHKDFDLYYARSGKRWEDLRDAYRFGYDMARETPYTNESWDEVRRYVQQNWVSRNLGKAWEPYEHAVQQGWEAGHTPH